MSLSSSSSVTYLALLSKCLLIWGTMLESFVLLSNPSGILFVRCLREGNQNVFAGSPFVEVVFDLDPGFISHERKLFKKHLALLRKGQVLPTRGKIPGKCIPWQRKERENFINAGQLSGDPINTSSSLPHCIQSQPDHIHSHIVIVSTTFFPTIFSSSQHKSARGKSSVGETYMLNQSFGGFCTSQRPLSLNEVGPHLTLFPLMKKNRSFIFHQAIGHRIIAAEVRCYLHLLPIFWALGCNGSKKFPASFQHSKDSNSKSFRLTQPAKSAKRKFLILFRLMLMRVVKLRRGRRALQLHNDIRRAKTAWGLSLTSVTWPISWTSVISMKVSLWQIPFWEHGTPVFECTLQDVVNSREGCWDHLQHDTATKSHLKLQRRRDCNIDRGTEEKKGAILLLSTKCDSLIGLACLEDSWRQAFSSSKLT
jgi:hypothetical protein